VNDEIIFMTSDASHTGNLTPLVHEIRHALFQLIESGKESSIDLRRLPLSPQEEHQLETFLGYGEVKADIQALGDTVLIESRFSGVWLETHYNQTSDILGKYVHICICPQLIKAQHQDMSFSLSQLEIAVDALSKSNESPDNQES